MIKSLEKLFPLGGILLPALLPLLAFSAVRCLAGAPTGWRIMLQVYLLICFILVLGVITQSRSESGARVSFHVLTGSMLIFTLAAGLIYTFWPADWSGWLFYACLQVVLLSLISGLGASLPILPKLVLEAIFIAAAGILPVILNQVETRFSTEEFFVALEVIGMMVFWLFLRIAFHLSSEILNGRIPMLSGGLALPRSGLLLGLGTLAILGSITVVLAYQASFYPKTAPGYPGITRENPIICGESPPAEARYQGEEVSNGYLQLLADKPEKDSPDYALLALGTGDPAWADKFRESLLTEAQAGAFTTPTGSVKYGQYLAGKRAYFYPLIRDTFPDTFTPDQENSIQAWFTAINQRAFTVEVIDWMYALAYRFWPQGPYENQETGAGLIALLEMNGLADPDLHEKNQQYLAAHPRGWLERFRVTDDAPVYQPEWMGNAWHQQNFQESENPANQENAFAWVKALALPDGSPLRYNHIGALDYLSTGLWGASYLQDSTLLWLAGQAQRHAAGQAADSSPVYVAALPGAEHPAAIPGESPTMGSCLVYGDSGLPTQVGPLAPDKVVFRSGWEPNDFYLLLNLRFTGWHRYKATNAVTLLYQGEPLVVEDTIGETSSWLPTGRSIFRDKRIPRENLNSLQIKKTGLANVLYELTGLGGPWAQDPPYYAQVTQFETSPEATRSTTLLTGWHGWTHQREIHFYPEGVIVVFDIAQGPADHPAALIWHLMGAPSQVENRFTLGDHSAVDTAPEVVMVPIEGSADFQIDNEDEEGILRVQYLTREGRQLQTASVFLLNDWIGADVRYEMGELTIDNHGTQLQLSLESDGWAKVK